MSLKTNLTYNRVKKWWLDLFHIYDLQFVYDCGNGTYAFRKAKRPVFWARPYDETAIERISVPYRCIEDLESQIRCLRNTHLYLGTGLKNP